MLDRTFPFIGDPFQRSYYRQWKHARREENARKLDVCRVSIANGIDVTRFTARQAVLWRIDTRRQRRAERRGHLAGGSGVGVHPGARRRMPDRHRDARLDRNERLTG